MTYIKTMTVFTFAIIVTFIVEYTNASKNSIIYIIVKGEGLKFIDRNMRQYEI